MAVMAPGRVRLPGPHPWPLRPWPRPSHLLGMQSAAGDSPRACVTSSVRFTPQPRPAALPLTHSAQCQAPLLFGRQATQSDPTSARPSCPAPGGGRTHPLVDCSSCPRVLGRTHRTRSLSPLGALGLHPPQQQLKQQQGSSSSSSLGEAQKMELGPGGEG